MDPKLAQLISIYKTLLNSEGVKPATIDLLDTLISTTIICGKIEGSRESLANLETVIAQHTTP
jgi:hypothetical protein